MSKKTKSDQVQRDKKVKRIKTHHVRSTTATVSPVNVDCFPIEEEASNELAPGECFKYSREITNEIHKIFHSAYLAKQKKKTENLQSYTTDICVLIMKLKKLNRLDKHCSKRSRDAVAEGKQKADNLNLHYQNLLYEVTHLQKEVTKCLEFRSQDEEIELVSVEQFYAEAPKSISKPDLTKNNSHELTMARLQWELEQRKQLAIKLQNADIKKEECRQYIRKLKESLASTQPGLQSVLEATEPLQSKLGMPMQTTRLKHSIAKFLPKPLFTLYVELCTYKEVYDKRMSISVEGNVDDAKVLEMKLDDVQDDSGESDQEESFNGKRHRHSSSVRPDDSQNDILSKHPLSVQWKIKCKGTIFCVDFYYLFHLNIVTAHMRSPSLQDSSSSLSREMLNSRSLLKCLFENDDGILSPNPTNKYLLKKIEFNDTPFSNEKTGWPFLWTQHLSGLHFVSVTELEQAEMKDAIKASVSYIEGVITSIKDRFNARLSLKDQIFTLETGSKTPTEFSHLYPSNVISQLKKWFPAHWEEIMEHPKYDELLELGLLRKGSVVLKGIFERGSAVLTALIAIPPDYPNITSVFLLSLLWKIGSTAATNPSLRELEEEVNIHCIQNLQEKQLTESLMHQVHHLLVCFDVFLETEHSEESFVGPCEFLREKVLTRTYRGRSHSRPYRYLPSKGIFTH